MTGITYSYSFYETIAYALPTGISLLVILIGIAFAGWFCRIRHNVTSDKYKLCRIILYKPMEMNDDNNSVK